MIVVTFLCFFLVIVGSSFQNLGEFYPCNMDESGETCKVDGYVGTKVLYEDDRVRVWNFTLAPGQMTSMHRHDYDYHFIAIKPTQLEVWGENGSALFNFRAEGTIGFKVEGDYLVPISKDIQLPHAVPRVHAAKNIGNEMYYEILFESKISTAIGNKEL